MVSDLVDFLAGKRLLLWGFGKEGRSSYRFLRRHFPALPLTVADARADAVRTEMEADGLLSFLPQAEVPGRLDAFDLVIKSPGIPTASLGLPSDQAARITGQADLFLRFAPGKVVGVTGTKGKSTTSHLLRHLLSASFADVRLGGNIGIPLWDLIEELGPGSVTVAELSSYQLEGLTHGPDIGLWLNLYEEHLNYHGSFAAYRSAKANLARFLKPGGSLVYRADDPRLMEGLAGIDFARLGLGRYPFDAASPFSYSLAGNVQLPGAHNRLNAVAAWTAARLLGTDPSRVQAALDAFRALPHRLEPVGTVAGVRYYNDSISTVPEATLAALEALPETDILIVGGMDRGVDYRGLAAALRRSRLRWLILMPETGAVLASLLRQGGEVPFALAEAATLEEAVALAKREGRPGGLCLLSPAASSYHQYRNFEERGEAFRALALGA